MPCMILTSESALQDVVETSTSCGGPYDRRLENQAADYNQQYTPTEIVSKWCCPEAGPQRLTHAQAGVPDAELSLREMRCCSRQR